MPVSLADLEQQRRAIIQRMMELPDFRSGSITATYGICGKPNCHCHQPNQPPHGPNFRLTRKVKGKTVTETFATAAELQKAQREVAAYQQFRELSQELIALNEKICSARPVEDREVPPSKKNGGNTSAGNQSRSRAIARADLLAAANGKWLGLGSGRDGGSFRHARSWGDRLDPTAAVRSSRPEPAKVALSLRPFGEIFRITFQTRADRRRQSSMPTPLLSV
jgi:hypothetical protein